MKCIVGRTSSYINCIFSAASQQTLIKMLEILYNYGSSVKMNGTRRKIFLWKFLRMFINGGILVKSALFVQIVKENSLYHFVLN